MDFSEIWSSLLNGSRSALSALFKEFYMPLLNYGLKIDGSPGFVKDCIQDVFLNLWEQRESLSEVNNVRAYLFTALRMKIIEKSKKERSSERREQDYAEQSTGKLLNVEQLMVSEEIEHQQKKKLRKAIQNLTKRQKEIIYLKFYNGFDNEEIAYIMQINQQSVYNLVHEALKNLEGFFRPGE